MVNKTSQENIRGVKFIALTSEGSREIKERDRARERERARERLGCLG